MSTSHIGMKVLKRQRRMKVVKKLFSLTTTICLNIKVSCRVVSSNRPGTSIPKVWTSENDSQLIEVTKLVYNIRSNLTCCDTDPTIPHIIQNSWGPRPKKWIDLALEHIMLHEWHDEHLDQLSWSLVQVNLCANFTTAMSMACHSETTSETCEPREEWLKRHQEII